MSQVGNYGINTTGVFERTLPPKSRMSYDPAYELGIEVARWFHYRYSFSVHGYDRIENREKLERVMTECYRQILIRKGHKKNFDLIKPIAVDPKINEFIALFRDVLAEMEFTG